MALVLTMRVDDDFFVGDTQVIVQGLRGRKAFELFVPATGQVHYVSPADAVEIMPDVFVSSGGRPQSNVIRVSIEAPRDMEILRGERYRNEAKQPSENTATVKFVKGSPLWGSKYSR